MADVTLVRVPDIGDFEDVEVIEVLVGPGDRVEVDDSLVSIESDKATMEIPSPVAGVVAAVHVSLGDRVSEGASIVELDVSGQDAAGASEQAAPGSTAVPAAAEQVEASQRAESAGPTQTTPSPSPPESPAVTTSAVQSGPDAEAEPADRMPGEAAPRSAPVPDAPRDETTRPHASPLVRRFARELGVALDHAPASGQHGRVLEEDVKRYVKGALETGVAPAQSAVPTVDPARFGPVHEEPLGKIRRVSARNLTQSWRAPHVTQHDEADVTELEAFRKSVAEQARERGVRVSPLHFVMKAVAIGLQEVPDLRSSLSPEGESLVVKDYVHLGIAVDTDHGLVVPVVRDVDRKGIFALAEELAELAERARKRRLGPADMQGAAFTISSLGGIGGTAFTPIVNTPEVAILGLSKLMVRPVWSAGLDVGAEAGRFEPRIVLPLSLSYDHRVIDGAVAVRFTTRLVTLLSHPAHLLL